MLSWTLPCYSWGTLFAFEPCWIWRTEYSLPFWKEGIFYNISSQSLLSQARNIPFLMWHFPPLLYHTPDCASSLGHFSSPFKYSAQNEVQWQRKYLVNRAWNSMIIFLISPTYPIPVYGLVLAILKHCWFIFSFSCDINVKFFFSKLLPKLQCLQLCRWLYRCTIFHRSNWIASGVFQMSFPYPYWFKS